MKPRLILLLIASVLCLVATNCDGSTFVKNKVELRDYLRGLEGNKPDFDDVLETIDFHSIHEEEGGEGFLGLPRGVNCAVVGSSLEILRSNSAEEIDSHDVVLRVGAYYDKAIFTLKERDVDAEEDVLESLCTGRSCYWGAIGSKMNYYYIETYDMIWVRRVLTPTWNSQGTILITSIYDWKSAMELFRFLNEAEVDLKIMVLSRETILDAYQRMANTNPKGRSLSSKQVLHAVLAAKAICGGDNQLSVYGSFVPYVGIFGYTSTNFGDINTPIPSTTDEWEVLKIMNSEGKILLKDLEFHNLLYNDTKTSKVLTMYDLPPTTLRKTILMPTEDTTLAPMGRIHQTCAVVGADPTVGVVGAEIDAHEAVFRSNHHLPRFEDINKFGSKITYLVSTPEGDANLYNMGVDIKEEAAEENSGFTIEKLVPLFPHINSYLYEPAIFPFQSDHTTSGVRWSTTTGFASFLMAYYRCQSIDVYGFSIGLPTFSMHNYQAELIAMKMLEYQNRFSKTEPKVRLFLNRDINNYVFRWILALEQHSVGSADFMMAGTPL
jgi:hypothetical protein